MDQRFSPHNSHLEGLGAFSERDPQLSRLKLQKYVFEPPLLASLPATTPGIYTLGGGRQIGKTTLLKQWMRKLMQEGVKPESIFFFSGELIDDHHSLLRLLDTQLSVMPQQTRFILLDEVSYIRDWDKAIKYAADSGLLDNTILLLTGSDLTFIQEARMRFPGRRGSANEVNFHLYPLSFREFVHLVAPGFETYQIRELFSLFDSYLVHGGFLTAINDFAKTQRILNATLDTYSDWIRGDILKRGKSERYLREIIAAIIKRYNTQVSWNALADDLSIDHPQTVSDYVNLLESMDAVFIQYALLEDKLTGAPKKARKVVFTDPFIFHALSSWIWPSPDPFTGQIQKATTDPERSSALVEACVTSHVRRFFPTYYIKSEGEVDVAYVHNNRFWPIEIKWTKQLRAKDLKQIAKYPNGRIWAKIEKSGMMDKIPVEPLPLALYGLGAHEISPSTI